MITEFGDVMVYVDDPRAMADFWVRQLDFTELGTEEHEGRVIAVEISHDSESDAAITLFDRAIVAQMSPELDLGTPSILFKTPDVEAMRERLAAGGVTVGDVVTMGGRTTFNFADPEGHWFAVQETKR